MASKIAVAYSGGLDTSAMIPWLREHHDAEVVAIVADVGQGEEELAGIEAKALRSGAAACEVVDLREEFVEEYLFPMLLSGAVYEGRYLLGTAIARPAIAKAQVEAARRLGCDALAHGCTGKGNDQVRFEAAYAALAPDLEVIAAWRHWEFRGREDLLAYLAKHGIASSASASKIYSRDGNLWHLSHEGGALEDPWNAPPADLWVRTADPQHAPAEPAETTLSFVRGRPRAIDGRAVSGIEAIEHLNRLGGEHGVGRVDLVENRLVGMKSRGCYETPGGTILMEALAGLEELVLDRRTLRWRREQSLAFAELIYDGRWFTPLREVMEAAFERIADRLEGEVRVRVHRGTATTVGRRSPRSLYAEAFATFSADEVYRQSDAGGFIRLFTLPSRIEALRDAAAAPTAEAPR
jgi:argininosuccinate synthase